MGRITVVATKHKELGLCTEGELLRILEEISPDVIFEEIRPTDLETYHRGKITLETGAIGRYLKTRAAQQIPVDEFEDSAVRESYLALRSLEGYVERNSLEWCALFDEERQKTTEFGFRYLNSADFEAVSRKSRELLEEAVSRSDIDSLKTMLSTWNHHIRRREASMLKNIHDFCRTSSFSEGAFLVGAEHLSGIVDGIEKYTKAEPNLVTWTRWGS